MNDSVEQIKQALPIEEVISEYVRLKPAGSSLKGLCPFHSEKTPSFFVSPERGLFKCFGCGKSGDIFTFIQEIEGIDFKQALEKLAQKAGIELKNIPTHSKPDKYKDTYFQILKDATQLYRQQYFANKIAQEYMKSRHITDEIIELFQIGFAPNSWDFLLNQLIDKYKKQDLINSGLFKQKQSGELFDKFRGRVMFPIFNEKGEPVAFTGRILPEFDSEHAPKYLNSPETKYFIKSHLLFGYNIAKQFMRKYDFAILAEGQMDVLAFFQAGFRNAVASSGTSVTLDHLKLINRFTKNLLVAMDADEAGINSTLKIADTAVDLDFNLKVIEFDTGTDPADIVGAKGEQALKEKVKMAKNIFEFLAIKLTHNSKDKLSQIRILQQKLFPIIAKLSNPAEKDVVMSSIAKLIGVSFETLKESVELAKTQASTSQHFGPTQPRPQSSMRAPSFLDFSIEQKVVAIAVWQDSKQLIQQIKDTLGEQVEKLIKQVSSDEDLLFAIEAHYTNKQDATKDAQEYLKLIKLTQAKQLHQKLTQELFLAQDAQEEKQILKQIEEISKQIAQLQEQ